MARILVVEDESDIALGLQLDLTDEGHAVEVVGRGDEASRRGREPWDLIILDVMLPGRDGFEVCRDLRRAGVRTPVLMLTAKEGPGGREGRGPRYGGRRLRHQAVQPA